MRNTSGDATPAARDISCLWSTFAMHREGCTGGIDTHLRARPPRRWPQRCRQLPAQEPQQRGSAWHPGMQSILPQAPASKST